MGSGADARVPFPKRVGEMTSHMRKSACVSRYAKKLHEISAGQNSHYQAIRNKYNENRGFLGQKATKRVHIRASGVAPGHIPISGRGSDAKGHNYKCSGWISVG